MSLVSEELDAHDLRYLTQSIALSEHRLLQLTGDHPENPTFSLPCREVFARGQRKVEVLPPALEDEAARAHEGFWLQR